MSRNNAVTDELFKQIADRYVEQCGVELFLELEELQRSGVAHATPRMDRIVRERVGKKKRTRYWGSAGLIAACLVLALVLPRFMRYPDGTGQAPSLMMEQAANDEMGTAEEAVEEEADIAYDEPQADAAPEMYAAEPALEEPVTGGGGELDMLPITFELPYNFWISAVEQDQGQTIYYLEDLALDNVVMTMELGAEHAAFDGLTPIELAGETVYGESTGDYNLLTFERDDILYVLTCKHDLNTLLGLGSSILL